MVWKKNRQKKQKNKQIVKYRWTAHIFIWFIGARLHNFKDKTREIPRIHKLHSFWFMRFAFLWENGLFSWSLLLSLMSKDKVNVEPIVRTNLKCLLCFANALQCKAKVHALGFQGRVLSFWGDSHRWMLLLNYENNWEGHLN